MPYLAVEFVRTATPTAPKGKKVCTSIEFMIKFHIKQNFQDEDTGISYHGVAYIETAPLLYPGGKVKLKES